MNRLRLTLVVALAVMCSLLVVPVWAVAQGSSQTPVSVPPNLGVLEQKMAQIRFNTASVSGRSVLGEMGPAISGAELGVGAKGSNTLVASTVAVVKLSPPESTSTSKIEAPETHGHTLGAAGRTEVRTIGNTVYTYTPSVASIDGDRPWVRSTRRSSQSSDESAGIAGISHPLISPATGTGAGGGSVAPFAKLIADINTAASVQEVGAVTVDGQPSTEFIVSSSLERVLSPKQLATLTKGISALGSLLSPTESPKQRAKTKQHREEAAKKLGLTPVTLELFITPSGLPVRTISVLGSRSSGIGGEEDILALEVPVDVHAPPPRQTIGQAQLRKLERKRLCTLISKHGHAHARSVLCAPLN